MNGAVHCGTALVVDGPDRRRREMTADLRESVDTYRERLDELRGFL